MQVGAAVAVDSVAGSAAEAVAAAARVAGSAEAQRKRANCH